MRKPFCLPRIIWIAASSPRFTRCNTVWRETPSANVLRLEARHIKVEFGERTALPSHREMGRELVTLDFDDGFFEQRPEQLLAIARRSSRGGIPHSVDICADRKQACALCLGEHAGALLLATRQLSPRGFERAKALLPIALEAAGNQKLCTPSRFQDSREICGGASDRRSRLPF